MHHWQVKPLTSTIRGQIDYHDGQTDEGLSMSMFTHARKITLAERAATVASLEEAVDEIPFVASASPGTAVRAAWDKELRTAYTSDNLFN